MDTVEKAIQNADRLRERGEYQHASLLLDEIISENPDNAKAFWTRASLFASQGLFKEAAADLDLAIELIPESSANFCMQAFYHLQLGSWRRVVSGCSSGLRLGNESQKSCLLMFRAEALIALGRMSEAMADLEQVDDDGPLWTNQLRTKSDLLRLCKQDD